MNEQLRAHVTRVGFDLTLPRSAIAALAWIEELRKERWDSADIDLRLPASHPLCRAFGHFITGARALEERGLLEHRWDPVKERARGPRSWQDEDGKWHHDHRGVWRITRAGRLVIGLLQEAGLYEEYAAAVHTPYLNAVKTA